MKILYVTNMYPTEEHPYYGIFVKEQIDAIVENNHFDHKLYFIQGYRSRLEYIKSIFMINFLILRWKPDIVHVHYGISGLFLLLNPFIKKRTILMLHGGDINIERGNKVQYLLTKTIVTRANQIFVLNDSMYQAVKVLNSNVTILPCGVNSTFFKCYKENIKKNNNFILVFPGNRSRDVKDFPLFTTVNKNLQLKYPHIKIIFKEVHNLTRNDVVHLLCHADCMLMTSKSEGSPQIIKEAMSCQLPIVSVNVGDVKNVLNDVTNCYVARTRDNTELEALVSKIIENRGVRTNGRDILNKLSLNNNIIVRKIINLYTSFERHQ